MDSVDVWLISLGSGDRELAIHAFAIEFELSLDRAREITARLPRVVVRSVAVEDARAVAERLATLGVVAEVRPSAPAIELSAGARPGRASQPVPAAPPVSLLPRPAPERVDSLRPSLRARFDSMVSPAGTAPTRLALGIAAIVVGVVLFFAARRFGYCALASFALGVLLIGRSRWSRG